MNNSPDCQKAIEMRQIESLLMEAVLMVSSIGDYKDFSDNGKHFKYQGPTAYVEFDQTNGMLQIYLAGQKTPLYDSADIESCSDLDQAWSVAYQLVSEIQSSVRKSSSDRR